MTSPSAARTPQSVALLDGKPYLLAEEGDIAQIEGVRRRWDVRRVTRQAGDPEPEFAIPLETFSLGSGISYGVLPGGYESADGWDLSAPGKALTWPRLASGEAFEYDANYRGWLYYSFATNYLYVFRGGYAVKYEPDPTPGSVWPVIEIHYFGTNRVVTGKWAEYDGKVYVPLINPTTDTEEEFAQLDTISTPVTEVQVLTETGSPTGGTFTVTFDDGVTSTTTGNLAFNITAPGLQTALRAIPGLQLVTVSRTGTTTDFVWTVTMTAAPSEDGTTSPPQFTVDDSGLTGGAVPAVTPTTSVAGTGDEWNVGPNGIVSRYFQTWDKPGVGPVLALIYQNFVQLNGGDPMTSGDWGAAYPVDNSTYRCTALAVWDRYLMVGKQNGLYSFDEQAVARLETKDLAGVIDSANFVGMVEAGGYILAPHKNGLLRWSPGRYRFVGAESDGLLEGEVATGWGRYLGIAPYGRYTYHSITDTVNALGVVGSLVAPGSDARGPLTPHMHQQFATSAEDIISSTIQQNPPRPDDIVSGADLASVGTIAWTDPGNIAIADAEATAEGPGVTHYLKALMPAVTRVPSDATVNGIEVSVDRKVTEVEDNSGALSPGSGTNLASVGTNAWADPGNITASDNAYATCATAGQTQGLRGSTYGAAVPTTATILGITAAIERKAVDGIFPTPAAAVNAGTVANQTGIGTNAWSNATNAQGAPGADAASASLGASGTNYLKATNFGVSIPGSGAVITGVGVRIKKAATPNAGSHTDLSVRLVVGGVISGDNLASGAWPNGSASSTTYVSYGGSATLWGLALTEAQVEASDFGVVIAGQSSASTDGYVSGFEITVYYGTPDGVVDSVVRLVDAAGAVTGDNKASGSDWPAADAVATYGGAADLWGATLTPAIVNNANFGVIVSAQIPTDGEAYVDHITLTIHYQDGDIVDNVVRLVVGGVVAGDDLADTATAWPAMRTTKVYGGPANLWGLTPTPAEVNAATFGFVLSADITAGIATLYGIATVRIYYTSANGDPGAMLVVVQVDADGVTGSPYAYELARSGLPVANDPNVGHAASDVSFRTSRIFAPSRNTQKTWRSVEFHAALSPEVNTPGGQMWASVDDGAPFPLLDASGATLTAEASGDYEAFFPDSVSSVGRWVQLIPTVPALTGGEVAVSFDVRDVTLHGSFTPKTTDYVTAVFILKQMPALSDGTTDRRTPQQQYTDLLALCGPRPADSPPIALRDPETGENTTCVVTGEPRLQRVRFQNATDPVWVAVVTLRKTPRA